MHIRKLNSNRLTMLPPTLLYVFVFMDEYSRNRLTMLPSATMILLNAKLRRGNRQLCYFFTLRSGITTLAYHVTGSLCYPRLQRRTPLNITIVSGCHGVTISKGINNIYKYYYCEWLSITFNEIRRKQKTLNITIVSGCL